MFGSKDQQSKGGKSKAAKGKVAKGGASTPVDPEPAVDTQGDEGFGPEPNDEPDAAQDEATDGGVVLGFLAVSPTAARRAIVFPIMPGFNESGPRSDLEDRLAMGNNWKGYSLVFYPEGEHCHLSPVDPDPQ